MQAGGGGDAGDTRGRHRIQAELKKLEQEARFLEDLYQSPEKQKCSSVSSNDWGLTVYSRVKTASGILLNTDAPSWGPV
ncbi:hypothetical protein OsI_12730 [Oryza sativa Indica Group]|uniref:Uncharacterized protein n=3 Tax=Oryza TaxID=4527 RepID=Q75GK8_ORYSJ|nr:hypothetical protein [Oryza sativa Japonica Group]EAY91121.1 hypothetical protein OsI_12730 [Oryza sativa Indica Group]